MTLKKIAYAISISSALAGCVSTSESSSSSHVDSSSSSVAVSSASVSSAVSSSISSIASTAMSSSVSSSVVSSSSVVIASSSARSSSSSIRSSSSSAPSSSSNISSAASSVASNITPTAACPERAIFGARQVKLLKANEYQNTVEDLVGIDFKVIDRLPTDDVIEDFYNNFAIVPTEAHIDAYLTLADDISSWAKARNFSGLVNCDVTQAACHTTFAKEFGAKAYRRPLADSEVQTILKAADDARLLDNDNKEAVRLMMLAILSSPEFLFRYELGQLENDPGPLVETQYAKTATTYQDTVNTVLDTNNRQFYVRPEWPQDSALIEITASAVPGTGNSWPKIKIRNATTTFDTVYELAGSDKKVHQIYIPQGIVSGLRHFYIYLQNPAAGTQLNIEQVSISAANIQTVVTPYEPTPDDIFALDQYEMASFLSYTFTGSMPDAPLMQAAKNGALNSEAQIEAQVDRLLATARGRKQLEAFADQWLGVDIIADASTTAKDPNLFPNFTQPVRDALAQEVREMFKQNVLTAAPFSEFFDSDYVYINKTLADFYGLTASGAAFEKANAGNDRGGFLTTSAFLGSYAHPDHTAPIIRAVRIREKLMCQYLPDPPNNLDLERAESAARLSDDWQGGRITAREYFGELTAISACAGCHASWINPLGFALEDYDPIGQARTQDTNQLTTHADGTLFGENSLFDNDMHALNGAKSLSQFLAQSDRTDYCLTEKAFRYMNATGPDTITRRKDINIGQLSNPEKADYACAVDNVSALLTQSQDVKDVFKKLAASNIVRFRKEKNR